MPDSLEIFINEQRADVAVFRIILQGFLLRLFASDPPSAEEQLQGLKTSVMGAIGRIQTDPSNQSTERMKQMTAMRAEQFFGDLEETISKVRNKLGESGRN